MNQNKIYTIKSYYYYSPFPCGRVVWIQLQTLLLSLSLSLRILRVEGTAFIEESRHGAALYPVCRRKRERRGEEGIEPD